MKFFKLELINRENNYNKMFNATPNIGTLNVLENKVYIQYLYSKNLHKVVKSLKRIEFIK